MDKKSYAEKLRDPRWQKKRLEIFKRDGFACRSCGDKKSELHLHHKSYSFGNEIWDYPDDTFLTLCSECHKNITISKKEIRFIIDECFVDHESLSELHGILTDICRFDAPSLSEIAKHCAYIKTKKNG